MKEQFLYPRSHYHGKFSPNNLVFNANLQEFAQKVSFISALETNGKLTPLESYNRIKNLWEDLNRISQELEIQDLP
ncbi:MAG: hypothetical protein J7545_01745 [Roseofilum sp. SBFL]|uniref:DUF7219 family protein n=1 Tax=unclassified Roseofilum TaxID=2620099 RepID=UPI001B21F69C|nr:MULTISPECIES: hypothetical protein [unclassified Roseofilum]MBP0014160.1 hypothetical protein [Roseofilum sp. SID3]MBP0024057.1 hypothetical protein [Roseofilum sp. SID2]MBP0036103.1 hypothetical protein [Roseofilum sp. SID1]MBP0040688.1 hypothetical protein [Roseofilum sp. SBFL]